MKINKKIIYILGILFIIGITIIFLPKKNQNQIMDNSPKPIESIQFIDNLLNLEIGETYQLDIEIIPTNYIEEDIIYLINDDNIATIDQYGRIKALKEGSAIVTAITHTGKTTDLELVVSPKYISINTEKEIKIEKLNISENTLELQTGSSYQLNYQIYPENATDKNIFWETSDARVATITDDGLISARAKGTVILNAYQDINLIGSVTLKVKAFNVNLSDIELNPSTISLKVNDSYQMKVNYLPSNSENKNTTWNSSNESIVSVSNNGLITALKEGIAKITATSNGISKTSIVTVTNSIIDITSISLEKDNINLHINDTYKLNVNYLPTNASNKNFIWSSSNTNTASVSSSGVITAIKEGSAKITVKSTNGKTATINVTVLKTDTSSSTGTSNTTNNNPTEILINVNTIQLEPEQSKQLKATILPLTANQNVTWVSGNESVATVSSSGKVKAKKPGKTVVSAISNNGLIGKVTVTVKYPPVGPATAATIGAPGDSISKSEVERFNDHLDAYMDEAEENALLQGINPKRAEVLAAAYFLVYNPYYKVSYNFSGKDSIGSGWFKEWGNYKNDPKYPIKGIDCNAFIRWSFYQVYGKDIGSIGRTMRTRDDSGLLVRDIAAVAEPGDVLRKDKNLMGGVSGHVAFVYSVDRAKGTISIIHASGSKDGLTVTVYNRSNSRTNFNYLYDMNYIYQS